MPIYEFACRKCGQKFETFVLSFRDLKEVCCPHCGSEKVQKVMSAFSRCASSGLGGGCGGGSTSRFT
ncbi:zinc ribbon domain-containing protein [Dissulfurirhabdus thermomarina]|uniref:Zinc ribbon domain-containing protein n=1 Tax=Dissulfurirhabdus thermomarina TaxID=1765737 RepID=A0A6N9TMT2_DISTH|nr:zinc ribbon domain-containing protein [Dissulfurirhabdus thermomarina]NDY42555.1 zinc ribbon domain-containing protein [Dissulfurirhabdus thermomarina]NMX23686.1 zinc ribbon domain-containing protein [Dissulfurirhabdus thermomarina]